MADSLLPIPLTKKTVHLCIDMQRIFSSDGPWATPWMERVLPVVSEIAGWFPECGGGHAARPNGRGWRRAL
jgi:hypothetical protein